MKQMLLSDVLVNSFNDFKENVTILKDEQSLAGFQNRASKSLKKRFKQADKVIVRDLKKVKKQLQNGKKEIVKLSDKLEEMVTGKKIKAAPAKRKTTTTTGKASAGRKAGAKKSKKKVTKS